MSSAAAAHGALPRYKTCRGVLEVGTSCTVSRPDGEVLDGTVRYVGPAHLGDGIWVGVELDWQKGKHNGTVDGVTYFVTGAKRGIMARPDRVLGVGAFSGKVLRLPAYPRYSEPPPQLANGSRSPAKCSGRRVSAQSQSGPLSLSQSSPTRRSSSADLDGAQGTDMLTPPPLEPGKALMLDEVLDAMRANTIQVADLRGSDLGDDAARALATALATNTSLEKLDLSQNNIGNGGALALATVMGQNVTCGAVELAGNVVTPEGRGLVASSLIEINDSILSHHANTVPSLKEFSATFVCSILAATHVEPRALQVPSDVKRYLSREGRKCPVCSRVYFHTPVPALTLRNSRILRVPVCGRACGTKPVPLTTAVLPASQGGPSAPGAGPSAAQTTPQK